MEEIAYNFIEKSEKKHWWFVGRRIIIEKILKSNIKGIVKEVLDIGSGFGGMIPSLLKHSENVDSIEPLQKAKVSLKEFGVRHIYDIIDFPEHVPNIQYDLVTLFDVLEHIQDQEKALLSIKNQILRPEGKIIITVPAYQWMWSKHDELNHHFRRYSKRELISLLEKIGFRNTRASYFMTFLFPLAVCQRLWMKTTHHENEFQSLPFLINWVLKLIFSIESWFIRYFPYPYGLSVVAIAEK